jgi:tRNA-Thr(GGU) m(6)t(6)A37 methyltransferase TsaA
MVIDPASVRLQAIGVVRSPYKQPSGAPIQGAFAPEGEGTVEVYEEFAAGLADLEGFSHIWLIYLFHLSQGYKLRVVPFMDDVERGLFATRAPRRPNPIGLSLVRLLRVEGPVLHLAEIDVVDGTPVLDIKPYSPQIDSRSGVRCGWLERIDEETRRRRARADRRFCGQHE